jgi:hypothetical protein
MRSSMNLSNFGHSSSVARSCKRAATTGSSQAAICFRYPRLSLRYLLK